jgi:hypothetical protein
MLLYIWHRTTGQWLMLQGVADELHANEIVGRLGRDKLYRLTTGRNTHYYWTGRVWDDNRQVSCPSESHG